MFSSPEKTFRQVFSFSSVFQVIQCKLIIIYFTEGRENKSSMRLFSIRSCKVRSKVFQFFGPGSAPETIKKYLKINFLNRRKKFVPGSGPGFRTSSASPKGEM